MTTLSYALTLRTYLQALNGPVERGKPYPFGGSRRASLMGLLGQLNGPPELSNGGIQFLRVSI